ncbi:MAG: 1-acyl-sn-glycerol-3-phosphate acyltransferase [Clostridium sp.]|nr:1-acyl-sn-glycerol-3-phosphate acyltransferase [Clostridium sp.]
MYKSLSKISKCFVKMFFRVEVEGLENIPKEGACIIAGNHKSNWDPVFVASLIDTRIINGVGKKELFKVPVLKSILKKCHVIPVDRENPDLSTIKSILKVLKNGDVIGIFPEGTRHKDLNTFAEVKAGLGMFAVKGKSPVVPVSIVTNYKLFSKVYIYIDKPMEFEDYYAKRATSDDYTEISNSVMNVIKSNYFRLKDK